MRRACRFKSCHPYQRCDANCCIAFFVSRNRNYVAPLGARPLRSVFSNATRLILPLLAVIRTNQSKTNLIGSFFCFLGKNNRTCGNRRLPTNYVCNLHCVQLTRLVRCTSIAITLAYSLQVLSSVPQK